MMMERAKPAAEEETAAVTTSKPASSVKNNSSAEERVNDLERRLNNLGGENTKSSSTTVPSQATSGQGKNNPLLARIIAAQDRARQAEKKEKEAKAAAQAQAEKSKREADAERLKREEEERIEKAQSALRLAAGHALESKQDEIFRELEGKPAVVDQPLQTVQPAVPIMKSLDPPPPFESMKYPPPQMIPGDDRMRGHGMNSRAISSTRQPPSFDLVMQNQKQKEPPAPSAPNLSPTAPPSHHLEGILPVAPPFEQAQKPPPSFDTFEQQQQQQQQQQPDNLKTPEEDIIDFDVDGNPLTPEQREAMIEEQRQLYANIMKEKAENDAAIAKATADAFDSRSSNAAVKAMDRHETHTQAMDSMGRNISGEEDDSKEDEPTSRKSRRMVKVGKHQMVALHGQGRTKKAIKDGTAILVQCINCQNWMQVTGTATLMFCPVCQVVSPVIKQTEVLTKEEAIQLTMDRKLAERLQAEAYEHDNEEKESQEDEGYFSKLFGARENSAGDAVRSSSVASTDSWWSKISNIVSYGVAEEPRERGDLGVTLPPGGSSSISTYPGERRNTLSPVTSRDDRENSHQEETHSLLRPVIDGNGANLPAARVAEQKPLFSCVTDSVSSAASALFSTGVGEEDEEGLIYGVDSSSLLVTSAGRDAGDSAGEYSRVSDNE